MSPRNQVLNTIGATPLLRLAHLEQHQHSLARIFGKAELYNPAGSVKDRIAASMVADAEARGLLSPGGTLVEASSGNTGIGLAMVAAARGYKLILTMPDTMSLERRQLLSAYGAQLVLTDGAGGMAAAMEKAQQIAQDTPGSYYTRQFENPANPQVHYQTTGPEIANGFAGENLHLLVAGVGTGGTITGAGKYLRGRYPDLRIMAVEPAASPVLSGGQKGKHKIQGIGAGFVPKVLDTAMYDQVITVTDEDAAKTARLLAKTEGLLAGISAGAALWAALQFAGQADYQDKNIAVVLPDSGNRYLSGGLFEEVYPA